MQAERIDIILAAEPPRYDVPMKRCTVPRDGVGARLTELRVQSGLSQQELAERIGVPLANIGFWERTSTPPSSKVLPRLAEALGVNIDTVLGVTPPKPKRQVAKGRLQRVFENAAKLPRRQQDKVSEFIEAFVAQHAQAREA